MPCSARAAGFFAALLGALSAPAIAARRLAQELEAAPTQTSHPGQSVGIRETGADPEVQIALPEGEVAPLSDAGGKLRNLAESGVSLASLVEAHDGSGASDRQMECLAGAIYFESKGEPLRGQLAVAGVIINRTRSGRYPASLCGVVKQPGQFSFVRGGRLPQIDRDSPQWRKAVAIAHIAANDLADSPVPSATAFHATYVSPRWRMKRLATVGRHVFYR